MPVTNQAYAASELIEAVRQRLIDVLELDDAYVRIVANDDYKYTNEETLIAIRPLGPTPYTDAGGGRRARPVSRILRIYLHKRDSRDFVGDDRLAVPELFDFEDEVFSCLDDFWPMNESGSEPMTIEPLHPTDSSAGPPARQSSNDIGELFSRLDFEMRYLLVNTTPQP